MANQTFDFTKAFEDAFSAFKFDQNATNEAYKSVAEFNEKLAKISLQAAEQNAELSAKWTKETISKLSNVAKAKADPAEAAKAVADFAQEQAQVSPEHVAQFAEIAKQAQLATVELFMEAGKTAQTEVQKAAEKVAPKAAK